VHELSIAESLIEQVEAAVRADGAARVTVVRLRIGALAAVDADALRFGFDVAAAGTLLEGAALEIDSVPVVVYCPACDAEGELATIQSFRCPRCGRLTADVRAGRELLIDSVEVLDETARS
jgi:hydrogenase nickel incorporation protein HypA/HybF